MNKIISFSLLLTVVPLFSNKIHKAIKTKDISTLKKVISGYNKNQEQLLHDINESTVKFDTPLHMAGEIDDIAMVEFLLENGAKKSVNVLGSYNEQPPLFSAVKNKNTALAKLLLENGAAKTINNVGFLGQTMLCEAAQNNDLNMVKLLLGHGAQKSINLSNMNQQSPLYFAIINDSVPMVKLLLENGAEVTKNIKNLNIKNPRIKQLIFLGY